VRTVVFFNLEDTLLRGEAQYAFIFWAGCRGHLRPAGLCGSLLNYLRYRLSIVRQADGPGADGFALLRGGSVPRITTAAEKFFTAKLSGRLRKHARSLVAAHRRCGHLTVLLTPAAELVVQPVAASLGIDVLLATRLGIAAATYTGHSDSPQPCGSDKYLLAQNFCARYGLELANSYVYASHALESNLLEAAGHPIAANPSRRLRKLAGERGWPVIDLDSREPVPGS
jgi:phosphoserine phosphatase